MFNLFVSVYAEMPTYVIGFFYFLMPYAFNCDNLATMFMIINRLSALKFETNYKKVYSFKFNV